MPLAYPDTPTYLRGAQTGAVKLLGEGARTPWDLSAPADRSEAPAKSATSGTAVAAPRLSSVEDQVVLAGRSVYYGALLWATQWAGSLWLAVVVQAWCVAWALHLVMVDLGRASHPVYWGSVALLSLATPLSVFAGLLMPDVWVALAIVAAAAIAVHWRALRRSQRWGLIAVLVFGMAGHASAVPVVAGVGALAWMLRRWRAGWEGLSGRGLGTVSLCLVVALMAEAAFAMAVTRLVGAPPLRLPHLSARLVDAGPGTAYLQRHCPQAGLAACAYVDHFPTAWTDFLFSGDPGKGAFALADAAGKRQLSQEQMALAWAVAREDPWGVARVLATDAIGQMLSFRVDVWGFGARELAMYAGRVPADWLVQMQHSRGMREPGWNTVMSWLTWASVAMASAWLLALWLQQRSGPRAGQEAVSPLPHRLEQLVWLVLAGVLANALVCGLLASPLDRFQARVVWLVPWMALMAAHARWVQVRSGTAGTRCVNTATSAGVSAAPAGRATP